MKNPLLKNKISEPSFENDYREVSYYKDNHTDDVETITLPKWLTNLIREAVASSYIMGKNHVKKDLKNLLEIK